MTPMSVSFTVRGEAICPDLTEANAVVTSKPPSLFVIEGGMSEGKPSIVLRVDLEDGKAVLCETSARLFCLAANMILAKYPGLFRDEARAGQGAAGPAPT